MISTLSRIGDRKKQNEDFLFIEELPDYTIGAVADGCGSGKDSSFASALICYLFREKIKLAFETGRYTSLESFNIILKLALKSAMLYLNIHPIEALSTIICFVYNKINRKLEILAVGDGVIIVNNINYDISQNGKPFYFAEHFDTEKVTYKYLSFDDPDSFLIATDGLLSFEKSQFFQTSVTEEILYKFPTTPLALELSYNILRKNKIYNRDDITMIYAGINK